MMLPPYSVVAAIQDDLDIGLLSRGEVEVRRLIFIVTAVRDRNIVTPSGNVTVEHAPRRCCPDIGPICGEGRYHRAEIAARLIASIEPDASRAPLLPFDPACLLIRD